ncbi:MAG TPA: hypothetical protein VFC51_12885 [Chloroflexota bacterium]|nr:hypothetical protein [Chloroflexota bacterium]
MRGTMLGKVRPGAAVVHNGELIGSVERVEPTRSKRGRGILLRHGRADYLLHVPERFITVESPLLVVLHSSLDLDAVEEIAIKAGRAPPTGEHITEGGHTQPSPTAEEAVGRSGGMPSTYDGPATG